MNKRILAPLALLTLALAIPTTAGAAVRCVPAGGAGCDSSHATINLAVTAASDDDEIRIAAGNYAESVTTAKRLDFAGEGAGTLGSSAGATVIAPPAGAGLTLQGGGSVRSLRVLGASGFSGSNAIILFPAANGSYTYTLRDVIGFGGDADDFMGISPGGRGVYALSPDAGKVVDLGIADSTFRGGETTGLTPGEGAFIAGAAMTASISRSTLLGALSGGTTGLTAGVDAHLMLAESTVRGSSFATRLQDGDFEIRRTRLLSSGEGAYPGIGLFVYDGTNTAPTSVSLVDSLVTSAADLAPVDSMGMVAQTADTGAAIEMDVRGSTVVAGGIDPEAAILVRETTASSPIASVDLRNSVAWLVGGPEVGEGDLVADRGTITADYSSFTGVFAPNGGSVAAVGSGNNLAGDPQLDADHAPTSSSPLIDRGDPSIVASGQLDLNGNPRSQDGDGDCESAPDIGALERASACSPPPSADPPNKRPFLSRVVLARKAFTALKPRRKGRRRGTAFRFALSEPARVRIAFFRRAAGRVVGRKGRRRCVKPTRRNRSRPRCRRWARAGAINRRGRAGRNRIRFSGVIRRRPPRRGQRALRPGRYLAVLVAIDPEGARSQRRAVAFRVLQP